MCSSTHKKIMILSDMVMYFKCINILVECKLYYSIDSEPTAKDILDPENRLNRSLDQWKKLVGECDPYNITLYFRFQSTMIQIIVKGPNRPINQQITTTTTNLSLIQRNQGFTSEFCLDTFGNFPPSWKMSTFSSLNEKLMKNHIWMHTSRMKKEIDQV